jgi:doublecortin-like kinase 3
MWVAGVILYIHLCGLSPLQSHEGTKTNIIQVGQFEFLSPYWENISDAAKDMVRNLLVVDPKKQYMAHQVLQHPWIEMVGHPSKVNPQENFPNSEGHFQSQHKKVVEQVS